MVNSGYGSRRSLLDNKNWAGRSKTVVAQINSPFVTTQRVPTVRQDNQENLVLRHNRSDDGTLVVPSDYVEVVATRR